MNIENIKHIVKAHGIIFEETTTRLKFPALKCFCSSDTKEYSFLTEDKIVYEDGTVVKMTIRNLKNWLGY